MLVVHSIFSTLELDTMCGARYEIVFSKNQPALTRICSGEPTRRVANTLTIVGEKIRLVIERNAQKILRPKSKILSL